MSRVAFSRKRVKLKKLLGIRARLALLALLLVAPLMIERVRSLEETRAKQLVQATQEFRDLAERTADIQREVVASVATLVKSTAYIRAAGGIARSCDLMRASLPLNLPWVRNVMVVGADGRVQCSVLSAPAGLDISDRPYFKKARESRDFVFSDFLIAKMIDKPMVMAAYPVSAINPEQDSVVVAGITLDWMAKSMARLSGRPGFTAVMIDGNGTILAAPDDLASLVGRSIDALPLMSGIADKALLADAPEGSQSFTAADGARRDLSFVRIPGTEARLVMSVDEGKVTASISRDIRTAYLQLAFVCVFVLIGALIGAEKLVIEPIEMMVGVARRFGAGDWSARVTRSRLPSEFVPLARAFNAMAAQLAQREREMLATNDRLTVMASIDMLSGLANRRGFQSRLDFEWMKAQQYGSELALLMIDVDHFKLYNDTYGHPEGDACLTKLGETLAGIAADNLGFAARYGGEEFCLLLPNTSALRGMEIGEAVRATIQALQLPHATSSHQAVTVSIGVACTLPGDDGRPGDLIEAADAALYAAKHRGRNTVVEHGFVRLVDEAGMALAG